MNDYSSRIALVLYEAAESGADVAEILADAVVEALARLVAPVSPAQELTERYLTERQSWSESLANESRVAKP